MLEKWETKVARALTKIKVNMAGSSEESAGEDVPKASCRVSLLVCFLLVEV